MVYPFDGVAGATRLRASPGVSKAQGGPSEDDDKCVTLRVDVPEDEIRVGGSVYL